MKLCNCVSSEIEYYMRECNFTEEEEKIFLMLSKRENCNGNFRKIIPI